MALLMVFRQKPTSVSFFLDSWLWSDSDSRHSCLGHVVNLAEVNVMAHITEIAAMETTIAIWEYVWGQLYCKLDLARLAGGPKSILLK